MNIAAVEQLPQVSENGNVTFCFFVSAAVTRSGKNCRKYTMKPRTTAMALDEKMCENYNSGHFLYSQFFSRKRPFSTKAQIGLSYTVEKGLFRLNFFD